MGKSTVRYYLKQEIKRKYIMELSFIDVEDDKFEDGIKYSLIFIEPKTGKRVLLNNNKPQSPCYYFDKIRFDYEYFGDDKLIADFSSYVFEHFGEKI